MRLPPLLRVSSLETLPRAGGVALSGVSLEVGRGEIVAVLGANGAGKTTLLRAVAGLLKDPARGWIDFEGRSIWGLPPEAIARRGLAFVSEERGLFRELSVRENLELGLWGRKAREAGEDLDFVHRLFPALRERASERAENLSGGQQQMLALGRALLRRPRLFLLDEPSRGLDPGTAEALFAALGEIGERGAAILLVEQNAGLALKSARRGVVLEAGRIVAEGPSSALQADESMRSSPSGPRGLGLPAQLTAPRQQAVVLRARGATAWPGLALVLVAFLALPLLGVESWTVRAAFVWLTAIGVLGQSLLIGHCGLVSFGQAGFLAIGAYAFAHLRHAGLPFLPALAVSGLLAALAGLGLGWPCLRLKGPYLAIATLGFGLAVYQILASSPLLSGGREGLDVPLLSPLFRLPRVVSAYYLYLALLLAFAAAIRNVLSSYVGRAFTALRESELTAQVLGIDPVPYKLLAFALSSFCTGVQGALYAQFLGHLEPQNFTLGESLSLFVAVVVGGLTVEGSLLGAAFVVLVPTLFAGAGWLVPLSFGAALLAATLLAPGGLGVGGRHLRLPLPRPPV